MPERQAVDLENAKRIEIVLVPFDDRATGHGGIFDRDHFAQRPSCEHHPAHMLRQVPRKAENLIDQPHELPGHERIGSKTGFPQSGGYHFCVVRPLQRFRQDIDTVERQAQAPCRHLGLPTAGDR